MLEQRSCIKALRYEHGTHIILGCYFYMQAMNFEDELTTMVLDPNYASGSELDLPPPPPPPPRKDTGVSDVTSSMCLDPDYVSGSDTDSDGKLFNITNSQ